MYEIEDYILMGLLGLIGLGILFLLACGFFAIVGLQTITGNGSQVGYVSAVEKSGILFKTGRVYIKPTLESTQEDIYCVLKDDVLEKLEEASVAKNKVKVNHFSWMFAGVRNCGGENAIVSYFDIID